MHSIHRRNVPGLCGQLSVLTDARDVLCCAVARSDLQRQLQVKDQLVQDAERRVADKQRGYNLLYADFAKQKAEAADAVEAAAQLQQQ